MLNINIICVGRLKEPWLKSACDEYLKRLRPYCKLDITELTPYRLPENPYENEIQKALANEGEEIISHIPHGAKVFSLCIEGKQQPSQDFAKRLEEIPLEGCSTVVFVIGGSYGLSPEVKARSDFRLSMSQMTFPHQMARVMLLEQIYRAFQISSGGKYHK